LYARALAEKFPGVWANGKKIKKKQKIALLSLFQKGEGSNRKKTKK